LYLYHSPPYYYSTKENIVSAKDQRKEAGSAMNPHLAQHPSRGGGRMTTSTKEVDGWVERIFRRAKGLCGGGGQGRMTASTKEVVGWVERIFRWTKGFVGERPTISGTKSNILDHDSN